MKTTKLRAWIWFATSTAAAVSASAVESLPSSAIFGRRSKASVSMCSIILLIVCTTKAGCSPTLVSPESINASAPSSTAFATSLASARVGRDIVIMESSICVATITGLPAARANAIVSFCTNGTSSSGSSTPKSPRATIIPSNALTISSMLATACGFSILAITGMRMPSSFMIRCTSSMSAALRTKESATMSTP